MAVLVSDSFNRANSTSTIGTTDSYNGGTVKTWQYFNGAVGGINNNQAYTVSGGSGDNISCGLNAGASDVTYSITLSIAVNFSNIHIRAASASSSIILQLKSTGYFLYTLSSGTYTAIGSTTAKVPANGDIVSFTCNGTSITVSINGTQYISATTTFNQTATIFGFGGGGSTARWDNFEVDDLNTGGSGTTYTGAGTASGVSSASDTNKLTAKGSGTTQGLSDVSTIASAILSAMGTADGQSSVTGNEIYVYSANGTAQGLSNVTGSELVIYLGGGTAGGSSSLTSNDTFTGVSGTTYSGSGTTVGGSNVSAVEQMILAASGTAQGSSALTTHDLITLMASGIASGYSTVTFVDSSMQIIGRIELKGERQLYVYLQGHRDLIINLKGSI